MAAEKRVDTGTSPAPSTLGLGEDYQVASRAYGSVEPHVFSDPERCRHWEDIYEKVDYEGRHRFDPALTWSPQSERLLKRKVAPNCGTPSSACFLWFV
jgi:hypothetical protein